MRSQLSVRSDSPQRLTGLEDECLDLLPRHAEHLRDLRVRQRVEFGEHQRRPLIVRQALHIADQIPEILACLNLRGEALGLDLLKFGHGLLPAGTQDAEAAVAGDREQPRTQMDRLFGLHQVAVGGGERVLNGVLGLVGIAEHVAAERQNRLVISVVGGLKGSRAALSDQGHEARIRGDSQQHRRAERRHS